MSERIRVVLVDDHHVVRRALVTFLEPYPDLSIVGEAASAEEVLRNIENWLPDVVVMDLLMPGGIDGIEAIRHIRNLTPHTQIVVLTSYTDDARVIAALRMGAIGYVRKDAEPEVLLSSIRAAARGQSILDSAVAHAVLQELTHNEKTPDTLTQREQEVLYQIAL